MTVRNRHPNEHAGGSKVRCQMQPHDLCGINRGSTGASDERIRTYKLMGSALIVQEFSLLAGPLVTG